MGKRVTLKIEGPPVFDDNGVPKGKGRPRASARIVDSPEGPRAIVSLHTPKDTVLAEKAIAARTKAMIDAHVESSIACVVSSASSAGRPVTPQDTPV